MDENPVKLMDYLSYPLYNFNSWLHFSVFSFLVSSIVLRKQWWSRVLMLHHSHVKFTLLQMEDTSARWYDIMRRFGED